MTTELNYLDPASIEAAQRAAQARALRAQAALERERAPERTAQAELALATAEMEQLARAMPGALLEQDVKHAAALVAQNRSLVSSLRSQIQLAADGNIPLASLIGADRPIAQSYASWLALVTDAAARYSDAVSGDKRDELNSADFRVKEAARRELNSTYADAWQRLTAGVAYPAAAVLQTIVNEGETEPDRLIRAALCLIISGRLWQYAPDFSAETAVRASADLQTAVIR